MENELLGFGKNSKDNSHREEVCKSGTAGLYPLLIFRCGKRPFRGIPNHPTYKSFPISNSPTSESSTTSALPFNPTPPYRPTSVQNSHPSPTASNTTLSTQLLFSPTLVFAARFRPSTSPTKHLPSAQPAGPNSASSANNSISTPPSTRM